MLMKDFSETDIERVESIIDAQDSEAARTEVAELHPADIAELFQSLNLRQAEWLFNLIDDKEKKADVLMELDEEDRKSSSKGWTLSKSAISSTCSTRTMP